MRIKLWMIVIFLFYTSAYGLEVDEKLPLRILKISNTKKTVLINRGVEDGLVVGDHAKFFLTTGVVARGIMIKSSPTRSVWSLYKLNSSKDIEQERVMNLKITPKVKLTKDPTKMLAELEAPLETPEGVALEVGADDDNMKDGKVKKMGGAPNVMTENMFTYRTWELFGNMHISSLTSENSTGDESKGSSGSSQSLDVTIGIEKYFSSYARWYGKISLFPFVHYYSQDTTSVEGNVVKNKMLGFGLGGYYHFLAPPLALNRFILFVGGGAGVGTSQDSAALAPDRSLGDSPSLEGKATFFSFGIGIKYNIKRFGMRAILDYYQRGESYEIEDVNGTGQDPYTKIVKGPRFLLGLAMKF